MAKPRGRQAHPGGPLQGITPEERGTLKARRLELGWKQSELARKAGTTTATISNLEGGRSGQTRREVYAKVRLALYGGDVGVSDKVSIQFKRIVDAALEVDEATADGVIAMLEAMKKARKTTNT